MPGGLAALLDDIAAIARTAAATVDDVAAAAGKTSAKAAGVVIDDAAVTPKYVSNASPARELPMIWRITKGSFRNKLIIILPIILLLNWLAPWALTPLLMLGGTYLCFEGAEKIWHKLTGQHATETPATDEGPESEDKLVKGAIMTDLILSAEIMVISLNEVATQTFWMQLSVLLIVAIGVTVLVYGAVGLLVKMDDLGLRMIEKDPTGGGAKFGRGLVVAMPKVLTVIAIIGTFAMLWVGGHIMIVGLEEFGAIWFYEIAHGAEVALGGGALGWVGNTLVSLIFGFLWGTVIVGLLGAISKLSGRSH
ncbi:DUF808 domain-containing protein [Corynebacterium sp. A21]|uniref:DUF808 domain-containing protein n=1 Tax=Corynebacterium sp. A21 TaxID=3457318 RepID=UPI003FD0FB4F